MLELQKQRRMILQAPMKSIFQRDETTNSTSENEVASPEERTDSPKSGKEHTNGHAVEPNPGYTDFKAKALQSRPSSADLCGDLFHEHKPVENQRKISDIDAQIREEVDALVNNAEETGYLREIKDIIDELNTILEVFKAQEKVIEALYAEHQQAAADIYHTVQERRKDIKAMIKSAVHVSRSLFDLLDLKQKQASVAEAHAASLVVEETSKQGQTILLLTVAAIIYASLSFIAAVFSMNAKEINGTDNRSLRDIFKIMCKLPRFFLFLVRLTI
jgi:hypothetical protein